MPHWDANGNEEWVCQKGGHICIGKSTWVERDSELSKELGCYGNVCDSCLTKEDTSLRGEMGIFEDYSGPEKGEGPIGLFEHCRRESGLEGQALNDYINRYYGHG